MENIDDIQLGLVKFRANADRYFSLFDKHIPRYNNDGKNKKFLLLGICNESVILKMCALNKAAKYYIIDQEILQQTLPILDENIDFEFFDSDLDMYDIIKGLDMKFDCVIMNPPYGSLALKIFEETTKHLNSNGICVDLSPTAWLAKYNANRPFSKYRKIFNGKIKNIEIIDHNTANSIFGTGNSIEELGIYTVKNNNSSAIDMLNYGFQNKAEKELYDKINMMNTKDGILTFNKCKYNDKYGNVFGIRKPFDVVIYNWHGGENCRDAVIRTDNKKTQYLLYFNSENEKQNFLNSLDTVFMNWYWRMFVVPGDNKVLAYMFRMSDYTKPWTDERFYKFFNITKEEQKIIEDTMAKYK